ncbi:hypothetical protein CYMTET_36047, partial [Cymbomonas tetramitiformis]
LDSDSDLGADDHWDCDSNTGCPWILEENVYAADLQSKYMVSFYWAQLMMSSVTPATHPYTNSERVFATSVAVLGVCMSALLFGNITVVMSRLDYENSRTQDHISQLDLFMQHHSIPKALSRRVRKNMESLWELSAGLDKNLLSCLPEHLQREVLFYVHKEVLSDLVLVSQCTTLFVKALGRDLTPKIFMAEDMIVAPEELRQKILFIQKGEVATAGLSCAGAGALVSADSGELKRGDFFGASWRCHSEPVDGSFEMDDAAVENCVYLAVVYCEIFILPVGRFRELVVAYPRDRQTLIDHVDSTISLWKSNRHSASLTPSQSRRRFVSEQNCMKAVSMKIRAQVATEHEWCVACGLLAMIGGVL